MLWTLPDQRKGKNGPQIELTGLNFAVGNHPLMIEFEAECDRFEVANVAWSTGDGYKPGQAVEFMAGYPGVKSPTYRVMISTGGKPLSALRLQFPGNVDLKQVRIRELGM